MKLPDGYGPREPCADGEHQFYPHNHDHVPEQYRADRCSERYWCVRCQNWYDGEACAA